MHQTYLILIQDGKLALAVGAAIEDRLQADGHHAVAFIPSRRGSDVDDEGYLHQAGLWGEVTPQVVALYEDGLLERLESLGLAAYVGVPADQDWRVVHWDDQAGAMLLPVVTARDLVDAIADRTPWHAHTTAGARVVQLRDRAARRAGGATSAAALGGAAASAALSRRLFPAPGVSRKIAAASVAGPMLLVGLPATAAVACTPAGHASAHAASGGAGATLFGSADTPSIADIPTGDAGMAGQLAGLLLDPGHQSGSSAATAGDAAAPATMPASLLPWLGTEPGSRSAHRPHHRTPTLPGVVPAPAGTAQQSSAPAGSPGAGQVLGQPAAPARSAPPAPAGSIFPTPARSPASARPTAPTRSAAPAPVARRPAGGGGGGGGGGIPPVHFPTLPEPQIQPPHVPTVTALNNAPAPRPPQLPRISSPRSSGSQDPTEDPLDGAPFDPNDPNRVMTASNDQPSGDGNSSSGDSSGAPAGGDGAPASPDGAAPGTDTPAGNGTDAPPAPGPVMLASGGNTASDANPGGVAGLGQDAPAPAPPPAPAAAAPAPPAPAPPAEAPAPPPPPPPPIQPPADQGLTGTAGIDPAAFDPAPTISAPIDTGNTGGTTSIGAPIVPPAIQPVDPNGGVSIGIGEIPGTGTSVLGANDGSGSVDGSLSANSSLGSTGGIGDSGGGDGGGGGGGGD